MTEKIEVSLTFNDFAKDHKSAIELKQLDAKNYKALLTAKAVEDQTKDIGFSDTWKKIISNTPQTEKKPETNRVLSAASLAESKENVHED